MDEEEEFMRECKIKFMLVMKESWEIKKGEKRNTAKVYYHCPQNEN